MKSGKSRPSYKRNPPSKKPFSTAVIVCEGKNTEPDYIQALIQYLKIHPARIKIVSAKRSNPVGIVEQTKEEKEGDYVFSVFDSDNRQKELEKARKAVKKSNITIILSEPCFEIWILLHYKKTTKPYVNCNELIEDLKKDHIPNYSKGDNAHFMSIIEKYLKTAEMNALSLEKENNKNHVFLSSKTDMHILVRKLREMAEEKIDY